VAHHSAGQRTGSMHGCNSFHIGDGSAPDGLPKTEPAEEKASGGETDDRPLVLVLGGNGCLGTA